MAEFRYDPYLWIHLAGAATVPLWLDLVLLGLAVDYPRFPALELGVLMVVGVLPVLVMQLRQPFCIFNLVFLALKPAALDDDRRRLLTLFRQWRVRLVALLVPLPLVWILLKIYPLAVVASDITPFASLGRGGGLAIAAVGFLMANLFLQVPASVLRVMVMSKTQVAAATPYPISQAARDFTLVGLPVKRILPRVLPGALATEPATTTSAQPSPQSSPLADFNDPVETTRSSHRPLTQRPESTLNHTAHGSGSDHGRLAHGSKLLDVNIADHRVIKTKVASPSVIEETEETSDSAPATDFPDAVYAHQEADREPD